MIKIIKGKQKKSVSGCFSMFPLEIKLESHMKKYNLETIGNQLIKQLGIRDGYIELLHLTFRYHISEEQ